MRGVSVICECLIYFVVLPDRNFLERLCLLRIPKVKVGRGVAKLDVFG